MKKLKVLIYEDTEDWKIGFEFRLVGELISAEVELDLIHKFNGSTVMEDLESLPHIVLVDYDLGESTGEEVLNLINDDPQYNNVPVILYSGGESIETLRAIAKKYNGAIRCYTKEGDDLTNAVVNKAKSLPL